MTHLELRLERGCLKAIGPGGAWKGESAFHNVDDLCLAVAALSGEMPRPSKKLAPVRVRVSAPHAQTRVLDDLPPLRERDLKGLIAEEATRFFRGRRDSLVTNALALYGRNPRRVAAVAIDRQLLQRLIAAVKECGLGHAVVEVEAGGVWLQLVPEEERAARRRQRLRLLAMRAALFSALLLGAGGWYLVSLGTQRRRLERDLVTLAPAASALSRLDQERRLAGQAIGALSATRAEFVVLLSRLQAAVGALPDSAYLTALSFSSGSAGSATGMARRPTAVLAALRAQAGFGDARLKDTSPHLPTAQAPWGQFTVQFGRDSTP